MTDTLSSDSMSDTDVGASGRDSPMQQSQKRGIPEQEMDGDLGESGATASGTDGIDVLLAKKKSELMHEIRHLKLGDKPVTSGETRKNIDDFMNRRAEAVAKAEQDLPANMDDVEQHRPEAVVVEVQGLFERRPVSSLLQSARFRRTLENAVRQGLSSIPTYTPQYRNRADSPASATFRQRSPSISSSSAASSRTQSSAASVHTPPSLPSGAALQPGVVPAAPPIPAQFPNIPQPWLMQSIEVAQSQQAEGEGTWHFNEELHRENIIAEISDLVHQQLVTSTLGGNFRAVLELQMQERLSRSDTDGRTVQENLQRIPRTQNIQRNDFSHLGIQAPGQDNLDNISIVSATAVPYAQTNHAMSRELQAVKTQLAELRNMMQLSFSMQLDIQRAIRQEVAAAMSAQPAAAAAQVHSRPASDTNCLICLDAHADAIMYQCGHLCTCYTCALSLKTRNANCPVCRAPIKDVMRVYQCNAKTDGN